jgi:tetratricopeptide (TPR) repeat protein
MKTTLNLPTGGTDNLTGTNSLQAYELYLQGMQNWHLRELNTVRKAEDLFLRAIEIDPEFAKAHAGLALVYAVLAVYSEEPEALYRPKVDQAARRALVIDPRNAEALAALGSTELDLAKGALLLNQAIAVNPSFATAYQWYGDHLAIAGDFDEGRRQLERAYELDPRSRIIGNSLAVLNMYLGRTDEALRLLEQMETFALDYNENLELEFVIFLITGQRASAEAVGKRLAEVLNKEAPNLDPYLDLFGETPQREAAANELLSWPRGSRTNPDSPAILYDYNLLYVMATASQTEPALSLMSYVGQLNPRWVYYFRFVHSLASFNCNPDAQAIYASLPSASPKHDNACPSSEKDLP